MKEETKVIFKKHRDGDIIAFFPDTWERGQIMCYQHIGQHDYACYDFYLDCKPCKKRKEYIELLKELKTYQDYKNLKIVKKIKNKL